MPDNSRRKEGVGNIYTDNPYGGPTFLSNPNSVTEGNGGGAGLPLGGGGGGSAPSVSGVAGPAAQGGISMKDILSWTKNGLGIGALATSMLRHNPDPSESLAQLFQALPELKQMLALQMQQAQRSDPLHAALVQLSMNLLPKSSRAPYAGVPNAMTSSASPYDPSAPRANRRSDLV